MVSSIYQGVITLLQEYHKRLIAIVYSLNLMQSELSTVCLLLCIFFFAAR